MNFFFSQKFITVSRNKILIFLTGAVIFCTLFTGCTANLWYIPGETGDGPVVNNNIPEAKPVELAVQEMINFLSVSAMINNWQNIPIEYPADMLSLHVFNGVAHLLQWHPTHEQSAARLESTLDGNIWQLKLIQDNTPLWEHSVVLQPHDHNRG